jgi:hypothetical protein
VTRTFFEFARLARPRRPRRGIHTVQWARHLFREHCLATPDPMVHLRMAAEESNRGVVRRELACQQLPAGGEVSPLSPGVGTSPELFLGFGQAERP